MRGRIVPGGLSITRRSGWAKFVDLGRRPTDGVGHIQRCAPALATASNIAEKFRLGADRVFGRKFDVDRNIVRREGDGVTACAKTSSRRHVELARRWIELRAEGRYGPAAVVAERAMRSREYRSPVARENGSEDQLPRAPETRTASSSPGEETGGQ